MIVQVTNHTHNVRTRMDARILNEAIIAAFDDDATREHLEESGRTVRSVTTLEDLDCESEYRDHPIGCEITLNNGGTFVIQIWHRC